MQWSEQCTRSASSPYSPSVFRSRYWRPCGVPLQEIRITAHSSSYLHSCFRPSLFEPVSWVSPSGAVCTGDVHESPRTQDGCTAKKLQLLSPSQIALHKCGKIEGRALQSSEMFGLVYSSKPSGLGACRLEVEAVARRKSTYSVHRKARVGRAYATSAAGLCVESLTASQAKVVSEDLTSVEGSALGAAGLNGEGPATAKEKTKRKASTTKGKVSSRSKATQAAPELLPEDAGIASPEASGNVNLEASQAPSKLKGARVSIKKATVAGTGKRRGRSASVAQGKEAPSSLSVQISTQEVQIVPAVSISEELPSIGVQECVAISTSLDSAITEDKAAAHSEEASDGHGDSTGQERTDEKYAARDQELLGVFFDTVTNLDDYVPENGDLVKASDVVISSDDGDALPQQKVSTNLRQSSLDWVRSTSAPIPRNLPMKVSKWRTVGPATSLISTVVPQRSETAQEILELLDGSSSFEDVVKTMAAYTGKVTISELRQILEDLGTKKDWLTASQLFDWLLDQPAYKPDETMYKTMINVLAKARRMDNVELIFECMEEDGMQPGLPEFSALIQGYLKSGAVYRAVTAFERMREEGIQPEVSLYNALLDGCARIPKGWETAISLYETMKQDKIVPDRATYTSMLLLACRKGRYSSTIDFFKTMMASGYPPDKSVYHAVLNAYAKLGDTRMMLEVFEQLSTQKMEYDVMTYNVVLNALGRVGDIGKASELYRRMRKAGVAADLQTCSILVTAFGKVQEWDELDLVLEEMQNSGLSPDLTVYNSLISVYGKAGRLDAVEQIVAAMMSASDEHGSKISFDLITYNTLVDVYGKAGRLDDVKYWFSEMKRKGFPPDVKTFNALLNAYGKAGLFDGVREVLRLFREHGNKPDLTFYNTLLFTFGRAGKYEDAWQIVADMEQAGCFPGVEIFNSLMFVFGRGSQYQAMKVYDYMVDAGISPNPTTFKLLIDIHGKRGMVDECLNLYAESLRILGKQVNESLLSSVFGACCNMRRIEDAEMLLEDLHTKQTVSLACHNWLILGYGKKGLWRKAELVLQEIMPLKKLPTNGQTYSFLLEAYSLCGQFEKAAAVAEKMMAENLLSGIGGYNSVLRYYIRAKRFQEALDLHDSLVCGQGPDPNHTSYAVLIECWGSDAAVNKRLISALQAIDVDLSPKVVLFSALLEALGRCSRSEDAVSIFGSLKMFGFPTALAELLLLDDVGEHDERWQRLAEEFQRVDNEGLNAEMQRGFHNAFVDALWILGWEVRALRVVEFSLERGIFGNVCTWDDGEWRLQLQMTSVGAAQVLLLTWIAQIQAEVQKGVRIADIIRIVLAAEWQVLVQDNLAARQAVVAQLKDLKAPFASLHQDTCEFQTTGRDFLEWLSEARSADSLFLSNSAASDSEMEELRKQALRCFHE